ncbi:sulfite exporter TauE/SafE family protein [Alkalicoccus halolimnae]|jgi:uncharacterized protein|uniref:Probable membrane transporter protein n=1 Tax=Alkalicoccus halolimnae TaxID=1667239 RepID=A0A5C7FMT3_9BACI|nr:sulfite exporter TauE/SafE family protein [Alkalicoccus halolimnae]TXF86075.1 sulfite exporter TauE/SafE family protein [Alkalicoccus halolimnae]
MDLSLTALLIVTACAVLIGISKTGLPTLGIFVVAVMASVFPVRESIGIVLPMLITADIVAVLYYRRNADWATLIRLIPWVSGGLVIGFIFLFFVEVNRPIEISLGIIIAAMALLQVWNSFFSRRASAENRSTLFTVVIGTLAGFSTMVGNAAGPVMAIFLLAAGLPKHSFIGTGAWFFLAVNLIKVPLYTSLGLITTSTLTLNAWMIPAILAGTVIGIKTLQKIPQSWFNYIILALALIGGIRLLIGA